MALTVRMSAKTERTLDRIAKRRNLSRSDVVREALAHYEVATERPVVEGPYEGWVDVIGAVDLGVRDPGRTTGDQFADLMKKSGRGRAR